MSVQPAKRSSLRTITLDDEEGIWELYEQTSNAAEVGRALNIPYHMVTAVLNRDVIRKKAIQVSRAEDVAARWEGQEAKSAAICGQMLDIVEGMIKHIRACKLSGEDTDLCEMTQAGFQRLSPTQAMQWLLKVRILDMVQKIGMTGAKICEGMKMMYRNDHLTASGVAGDPKSMTDAELHRLVGEIESAGLKLPWGVSQWKRSQDEESDVGAKTS